MADDLKKVLEAMEKSFQATQRNLEQIYNTNKALIATELSGLKQAAARFGQTVSQVGDAIKRLPVDAVRQIDVATKKRFEALDKTLDGISGRGSKKLAETIVSGDFKDVGGVLKGIGKEIGSVFVEAIQGIKDDAKEILGKLIQESIVDPLKTALQSVLKEAMDVIKSVVKAGTDLLAEAIRGATEWLTTGIKGILDFAFNGLKDLLSGLWRTISSALSSLTGEGGLLSGLGNSLGGIFGSIGGWIGGLFGGGESVITPGSPGFEFVAHSGGLAGDISAGRYISSGVFTDAPRYHRGGLPGLFAGEVPAILMRGEEVLTRRDPRHRANLAAISARDLPGLSAGNDNLGIAAAGQAVSVTYNIDARGADAGVEARIRLAMRESEARTINAVRELANRGGSYAKTLGRRA